MVKKRQEKKEVSLDTSSHLILGITHKVAAATALAPLFHNISESLGLFLEFDRCLVKDIDTLRHAPQGRRCVILISLSLKGEG
ncbi:MAG: hypothetical protein K0R63_115 [Rickettsiales bacterium]|jgi:hypothetical protein|nr:hypothetical protein [Rickettsiales bacterium]